MKSRFAYSFIIFITLAAAVRIAVISRIQPMHEECSSDHTPCVAVADAPADLGSIISLNVQRKEDGSESSASSGAMSRFDLITAELRYNSAPVGRPAGSGRYIMRYSLRVPQGQVTAVKLRSIEKPDHVFQVAAVP